MQEGLEYGYRLQLPKVGPGFSEKERLVPGAWVECWVEVSSGTGVFPVGTLPGRKAMLWLFTHPHTPKEGQGWSGGAWVGRCWPQGHFRVWLDQASAAQDCGKCQERGSVVVQLGPGPSP